MARLHLFLPLFDLPIDNLGVWALGLLKIMLKQCSRCGELKDYSCFNKKKERKDGLQAYCRECISSYNKFDAAKNVDHYRKYQVKYVKERKVKDIQYALKLKARYKIARIVKWIATNQYKNPARFLPLVGCTVGELKAHFESKFYGGMSWENYGEGKLWEVDHIIEFEKFDLTDPDQYHKCNHYSNLQPLTREDNLKKRKYAGS